MRCESTFVLCPSGELCRTPITPPCKQNSLLSQHIHYICICIIYHMIIYVYDDKTSQKKSKSKSLRVKLNHHCTSNSN
jgi:hypothetical protein